MWHERQRDAAVRRADMDHAIKSPSKEDVRKYMQRRFTGNTPPPSMKQIRRELGWELVAPSDRGERGTHALAILGTALR
jgi:hypothetical protein